MRNFIYSLFAGLLLFIGIYVIDQKQIKEVDTFQRYRENAWLNKQTKRHHAHRTYKRIIRRSRSRRF